jgi:hypothetical protein
VGHRSAAQEGRSSAASGRAWREVLLAPSRLPPPPIFPALPTSVTVRWVGAARQRLEENLIASAVEEVLTSFVQAFAAEIAIMDPPNDCQTDLPIHMLRWLDLQLEQRGVAVTYPESDSDSDTAPAGGVARGEIPPPPGPNAPPPATAGDGCQAPALGNPQFAGPQAPRLRVSADLAGSAIRCHCGARNSL